MQNTTLCYLEHQHQYLMLLRNKKKHDINKQKWIGIGGHLLEKETPDECVQREFTEETGLTLLDYKLRGLVTFISDEYETVQMWLYTASKFEGKLKPCDEG
ncbi:MAG TPA: DNA mismatch repair protein MutT, partial [Succinivibrio sp.]|nr:DNA mismatch repair protein MutT [Succinivibrio sp.]